MKSYFVKFAACLNKEDTAAARLKSKHESQQWAGFIVNTKNQNGQGNLSISPAAAPSSVYVLPRKVWKVLHHKFCCCGSVGCVHCVECFQKSILMSCLAVMWETFDIHIHIWKRTYQHLNSQVSLSGSPMPTNLRNQKWTERFPYWYSFA